MSQNIRKLWIQKWSDCDTKLLISIWAKHEEYLFKLKGCINSEVFKKDLLNFDNLACIKVNMFKIYYRIRNELQDKSGHCFGCDDVEQKINFLREDFMKRKQDCEFFQELNTFLSPFLSASYFLIPRQENTPLQSQDQSSAGPSHSLKQTKALKPKETKKKADDSESKLQKDSDLSPENLEEVEESIKEIVTFKFREVFSEHFSSIRDLLLKLRNCQIDQFKMLKDIFDQNEKIIKNTKRTEESNEPARDRPPKSFKKQ